MAKQNLALSICSCLCCCFLAVVNIFAFFFGLIFLLMGCAFAFGMNLVLDNQYAAIMVEAMQSALKNLVDGEVDISRLIREFSYITGSLGATFIVIGLVVVILACLGCCAGCRKIRSCLIAYAAIVGVLFVAQLIVVIIWYADSNVIKSSAKKAMETSVAKYSGLHSTNIETLLQNLLQINLGCCVVNNGSDFHSLNRHWNRTATVNLGGRIITYNLTYPVTCCQFDLGTLKLRDPICPLNNTASIYSNHATGCYDVVFGFLDKYFLNYLFYSLAGILGLQALLASGALVIYFSAKTGPSNGKVGPAI